jgi:hypothetical protein
MPPDLKPYFNYNVYRGNETDSTKSSYRTKPINEEACRSDLDSLYKAALSSFPNNRSYCTTQEFDDRKIYINGCYDNGFFKPTPLNKYNEKYSDLYKGVITVDRGALRKSEQKPINPNGCALKNK